MRAAAHFANIARVNALSSLARSRRVLVLLMIARYTTAVYFIYIYTIFIPTHKKHTLEELIN